MTFQVKKPTNCHSTVFVIAVLLLQILTKSTICTLQILVSSNFPPSRQSNTPNSLNLSALPGRNLLQKVDTQRTVPGIEQEPRHPSQTLGLSFSSTTVWGTPQNPSSGIQLTASDCYEVSSTEDPTRDLLSAQAEIQVSLGPPNGQENAFRLQEAEPPWGGVHCKENQGPSRPALSRFWRSTPNKPGLLLQSSSLHLHAAVSRDSSC